MGDCCSKEDMCGWYTDMDGIGDPHRDIDEARIEQLLGQDDEPIEYELEDHGQAIDAKPPEPPEGCTDYDDGESLHKYNHIMKSVKSGFTVIKYTPQGTVPQTRFIWMSATLDRIIYGISKHKVSGYLYSANISCIFPRSSVVKTQDLGIEIQVAGNDPPYILEFQDRTQHSAFLRGVQYAQELYYPLPGGTTALAEDLSFLTEGFPYHRYTSGVFQEYAGYMWFSPNMEVMFFGTSLENKAMAVPKGMAPVSLFTCIIVGEFEGCKTPELCVSVEIPNMTLYMELTSRNHILALENVLEHLGVPVVRARATRRKVPESGSLVLPFEGTPTPEVVSISKSEDLPPPGVFRVTDSKSLVEVDESLSMVSRMSKGYAVRRIKAMSSSTAVVWTTSTLDRVFIAHNKRAMDSREETMINQVEVTVSHKQPLRATLRCNEKHSHTIEFSTEEECREFVSGIKYCTNVNTVHDTAYASVVKGFQVHIVGDGSVLLSLSPCLDRLHVFVDSAHRVSGKAKQMLMMQTLHAVEVNESGFTLDGVTRVRVNTLPGITAVFVDAFKSQGVPVVYDTSSNSRVPLVLESPEQVKRIMDAMYGGFTFTQVENAEELGISASYTLDKVSIGDTEVDIHEFKSVVPISTQQLEMQWGTTMYHLTAQSEERRDLFITAIQHTHELNTPMPDIPESLNASVAVLTSGTLMKRVAGDGSMTDTFVWITPSFDRVYWAKTMNRKDAGKISGFMLTRCISLIGSLEHHNRRSGAGFDIITANGDTLTLLAPTQEVFVHWVSLFDFTGIPGADVLCPSNTTTSTASSILDAGYVLGRLNPAFKVISINDLEFDEIASDIDAMNRIECDALLELTEGFEVKRVGKLGGKRVVVWCPKTLDTIMMSDTKGSIIQWWSVGDYYASDEDDSKHARASNDYRLSVFWANTDKTLHLRCPNEDIRDSLKLALDTLKQMYESVALDRKLLRTFAYIEAGSEFVKISEDIERVCMMHLSPSKDRVIVYSLNELGEAEDILHIICLSSIAGVVHGFEDTPCKLVLIYGTGLQRLELVCAKPQTIEAWVKVFSSLQVKVIDLMPVAKKAAMFGVDRLKKVDKPKDDLPDYLRNEYKIQKSILGGGLKDKLKTVDVGTKDALSPEMKKQYALQKSIQQGVTLQQVEVKPEAGGISEEHKQQYLFQKELAGVKPNLKKVEVPQRPPIPLYTQPSTEELRQVLIQPSELEHETQSSEMITDEIVERLRVSVGQLAKVELRPTPVKRYQPLTLRDLEFIPIPVEQDKISKAECKAVVDLIKGFPIIKYERMKKDKNMHIWLDPEVLALHYGDTRDNSRGSLPLTNFVSWDIDAIKVKKGVAEEVRLSLYWQRDKPLYLEAMSEYDRDSILHGIFSGKSMNQPCGFLTERLFHPYEIVTSLCSFTRIQSMGSRSKGGTKPCQVVMSKSLDRITVYSTKTKVKVMIMVSSIVALVVGIEGRPKNMLFVLGSELQPLEVLPSTDEIRGAFMEILGIINVRVFDLEAMNAAKKPVPHQAADAGGVLSLKPIGRQSMDTLPPHLMKEYLLHRELAEAVAIKSLGYDGAKLSSEQVNTVEQAASMVLEEISVHGGANLSHAGVPASLGMSPALREAVSSSFRDPKSALLQEVQEPDVILTAVDRVQESGISPTDQQAYVFQQQLAVGAKALTPVAVPRADTPLLQQAKLHKEIVGGKTVLSPVEVEEQKLNAAIEDSYRFEKELRTLVAKGLRPTDVKPDDSIADHVIQEYLLKRQIQEGTVLRAVDVPDRDYDRIRQRYLMEKHDEEKRQERWSVDAQDAETDEVDTKAQLSSVLQGVLGENKLRPVEQPKDGISPDILAKLEFQKDILTKSEQLVKTARVESPVIHPEVAQAFKFEQELKSAAASSGVPVPDRVDPTLQRSMLLQSIQAPPDLVEIGAPKEQIPDYVTEAYRRTSELKNAAASLKPSPVERKPSAGIAEYTKEEYMKQKGLAEAAAKRILKIEQVRAMSEEESNAVEKKTNELMEKFSQVPEESMEVKEHVRTGHSITENDSFMPHRQRESDAAEEQMVSNVLGSKPPAPVHDDTKKESLPVPPKAEKEVVPDLPTTEDSLPEPLATPKVEEEVIPTPPEEETVVPLPSVTPPVEAIVAPPESTSSDSSSEEPVQNVELAKTESEVVLEVTDDEPEVDDNSSEPPVLDTDSIDLQKAEESKALADEVKAAYLFQKSLAAQSKNLEVVDTPEGGLSESPVSEFKFQEELKSQASQLNATSAAQTQKTQFSLLQARIHNAIAKPAELKPTETSRTDEVSAHMKQEYVLHKQLASAPVLKPVESPDRSSYADHIEYEYMEDKRVKENAREVFSQVKEEILGNEYELYPVEEVAPASIGISDADRQALKLKRALELGTRNLQGMEREERVEVKYDKGSAKLLNTTLEDMDLNRVAGASTVHEAVANQFAFEQEIKKGVSLKPTQTPPVTEVSQLSKQEFKLHRELKQKADSRASKEQRKKLESTGLF